MDLKDNLKIERYKLVTDRQKYFTELARNTFDFYIKLFISLVAGAIALTSAKSILDIDPQLLRRFIGIILFLISFGGLVSIIQISFCLWRWYGFRRTEISINPDSPPIKKGAWYFEGLYILTIFVSLIVMWFCAVQLDVLVQKIKKQQSLTTQSTSPDSAAGAKLGTE